jgi:hypothetical protein
VCTLWNGSNETYSDGSIPNVLAEEINGPQWPQFRGLRGFAEVPRFFLASFSENMVASYCTGKCHHVWADSQIMILLLQIYSPMENAPAPQIHTCGCRRLPSSGCCVAFSGTNEQCPQLSVLFHWLIGLQRFPYWDLNIQMHNEPWFVISLSPLCGKSKTTMCLGLTINDEEFWAFITWYYMHLSENRVPQIDGMSSNCLDLGYGIPPHYILTIVGLDSNNFLVSLVKSKCSVAPMQPQLLGGHYQFHTWCLDRAPGLDRWFRVTLCNTCVPPKKKLEIVLNWCFSGQVTICSTIGIPLSEYHSLPAATKRPFVLGSSSFPMWHQWTPGKGWSQPASPSQIGDHYLLLYPHMIPHFRWWNPMKFA